MRWPSGTIIGLAGVGEGDEQLTFPAHFRVGDALRDHWIRRATPEDDTTKWYVVLTPEEQPKSLVYQNGAVASSDYPIGLGGPDVTAFNFVKAPKDSLVVTADLIDVSGIHTPPSPPMTSSPLIGF